MRLIHTKAPIETTAAYIADAIEAVEDTTLCFLSEQSAVDVLPKLDLSKNAKRRTIFMLGEEKWGGEASNTAYRKLLGIVGESIHNLQIVDTSPRPKETHDLHTKRINNEFEKISKQNIFLHTIATFDISDGGHLCSIFPMDDKSFQSTYNRDSTYVSVHYRGLKSEHRASLTPDFILNQIEHIVGYTTGSQTDKIIKKLNDEQVELHLTPAKLIAHHRNSILVTT